MARFAFRLPDIGEGIAEAEIVTWHVAVGDRIEEDQQLADMMTDKATVEMESPVSGIIVELAGEVGDQVAIGSTLAVIETDAAEGAADEPAVDGASDAAAEPTVAAENPGVDEPGAGAAAPGAAATLMDAAAPSDAPGAANEIVPLTVDVPGPSTEAESVGAQARVLASPAVRARAKALGIALEAVRPAEDGRIRHADLDAFIGYNGAGGYGGTRSTTRPDEPVRVIGMRRRIAENMAASKRAIPHFTYVDECEVTALEAMRADLNAHRGDRPKLTMLPFLIVAVCRALPDFPMINARYDDEAGVVTRHGAVHLGMATQTDAGLMVPVIRDAQAKNVWQLATEIRRLSDAARSGKAKSDELSGSTLTITSLGPLGGIATTPVINRPEVAIIGPNKIIERAVFVDNQTDRVRRALMMNLSISCDHRVVDGWDAANFIQAVKKRIETPVLLFDN